MQAAARPVVNGAKVNHSFVFGSYCSTVDKYWLPSYPPNEISLSPKRQVATASLLLDKDATIVHLSDTKKIYIINIKTESYSSLGKNPCQLLTVKKTLFLKHYISFTVPSVVCKKIYKL